jgi:hypothetical protein
MDRLEHRGEAPLGIDVRGRGDAEAAGHAPARSDRISAWRLVATMVSRLCGFSVIRTVIASTSILSQVTSGNSFETSSAISSHITMPCRCAFDFVTT